MSECVDTADRTLKEADADGVLLGRARVASGRRIARYRVLSYHTSPWIRQGIRARIRNVVSQSVKISDPRQLSHVLQENARYDYYGRL